VKAPAQSGREPLPKEVQTVRTRALATALLGGAALVAGMTAPAAAATPAATPAPNHVFAPQHSNGVHPMVAGHKRTGFNEDGGNWSGYVATGGTYTSTSVSWNEPSNVSCNSSNDLMAPWVGIDGYGTESVEQTGVATDCSSGSPVDSGWYEMYPDAPVYYDNPVSPGDSITASVSTDGNGNYTLTLKDNTAGWTQTTPGSYQGQNASAEAIIESPTAAYPNFGSVDFTDFTINGQAADGTSPVALDASNSSGFEDHTGGLSGGNFSIAYEQE
jgi:hypothetical protein